ncbi:hypothetical protein JCM11641_004587 [Rhodosporidiobolus odoratus]
MDDLVPSFSDTLSNSTTLAGPLVDELLDEVDLEQCRLLGPFALVIQGIMGAIVLGSLVLKRMREKPRRKWKIWLGDVGKQVVGQAFVHASNVAISAFIASNRSDNPCSLYALNILIDTSLGVLLLYYFLRLSTHLMHEYASPTYQTGFYGHPFSLARWAEQAAVYLACLAAMKVVVLLLFWLVPGMEDLVSWSLSWLSSDEAQVFVVMLVLPLVMNLFQFLMVDSFLKSKEPGTVLPSESDEEAVRRGFLQDDDGIDSHSDDEHASARQTPAGAGDSGYVDEEEDVLRGTPAAKSPSRQAEQGLLDAEEGMSDAVPILQAALHSYPPSQSQPRTSQPRPLSTLSITSSLPPYSTLPSQPGSHFPEQQQQQPRTSQESEDDDWAKGWDAAEEAEREQPPIGPAASLPPVTAPALPSEASSTAPTSSQRVPSPPPLPTQLPSRTASPAPSPAPPFDPAATPHSSSDVVPLNEPEGEDNWGFGDDAEEQELEEEPLASPPRIPATASPSPTPPTRSPSPPPPARSPSPPVEPTPSLSVTSPAPAAEDLEEDLDDDWGFTSSPAPPSLPAFSPIMSEKTPLPPSHEPPPAVEGAGIEPSEKSPTNAAAEKAKPEAEKAKPEAEKAKPEAEEAQSEDDDEWGFGDDAEEQSPTTELKSAVDRVLGLKHSIEGAAEQLEDGGEKLPATTDVGKTLGVGFG